MNFKIINLWSTTIQQNTAPELIELQIVLPLILKIFTDLLNGLV